jgi:hypothetical protein
METSHMSLNALKDLYHAAMIEDDELGVTVLRPDDAQRDTIFELIVSALEADDEDNEALNPDYVAAARQFLERD